ncbi:MAG: transaldolase [Candidatus Rokubacteria bacterium]|nr:transaldolase [Candidatus Rokubacteria bacterium]
MKIFLDTAETGAIQRWLRCGIVDGVTTNPSIMRKEGVRDIEEGARAIAKLIGDRPLSVEVTTNDLGKMLDQARTFAAWAKNIVVKIPVINESGESCLEVINRLEREGIRVNTTAILSLGQFMLAAKAGATYLSIFAGRISDEGGDAPAIITAALQWLARANSRAEIIVGSLRQVLDLNLAAQTGAHILTIPPQLLGKWLDHRYSRETVRQFVEDAGKI